MLRLIARGLALLCAIAFVFAAVGAMFFQAAGTRMLRAPIYKRALARERVYDRFPALAAHAAMRAARGRAQTSGTVQNAFDMLAQLSADDWRPLVGALAPPAYLQAQTEHALDRLADTFHADGAPISAEISLGELKRNLTAPSVEETFLAALNRLPVATERQMQAAGGLPAGFRPPEALMSQVRDRFRTGMESLAARLPETFDPFAGGPDLGADRAMTTLENARDRLVRLEWVATWSPAIPAFLLALVAAFAVRSVRGGLLWVGIPCFVAGGIGALLAIPVVPAANWAFTVFVVPYFPVQAPAELIQAGFGVALAVAREIMAAVLDAALWLGGAGLVAVAIAPFFRRRPVVPGGQGSPAA